jgi:hypothetical protein
VSGATDFLFRSFDGILRGRSLVEEDCHGFGGSGGWRLGVVAVAVAVTRLFCNKMLRR